ncbi:hypothetical protein FQA47_020214 [Oryzias melastigma]|uniref:Uncharacterized protein n=1 Tax=Oryzias melastigma TaxID=30732 RepID=A0A834BXW8_ORYME|nr:hypothetical protein FQA47_020214 [Oryzias melastigma]
MRLKPEGVGLPRLLQVTARQRRSSFGSMSERIIWTSGVFSPTGMCKERGRAELARASKFTPSRSPAPWR